MRQSIELLNLALEKQTLSAWARKFNVVPSTFTNAKRAGRLSPALAGNLAIELGESPERWIAIAALEGEKDSPLLEALKSGPKAWHYS